MVTLGVATFRDTEFSFRMDMNVITCMLESRGRMRMSEAPKQEHTPTVQQLAAEVARLRERVEDLEDSRELDAAIRRNDDKPLIPWDQAKADLGLKGEGHPE